MLYGFGSGTAKLRGVELPFDTARSVANLWFSGAFERWSRIRFIFSHGGGALPMVADRIDKLGRPGKEPGSLLHDAATQFDNLYFDTANAASPVAFAGLRAFCQPAAHSVWNRLSVCIARQGSGRPRARSDESRQMRAIEERFVTNADARFLRGLGRERSLAQCDAETQAAGLRRTRISPLSFGSVIIRP